LARNGCPAGAAAQVRIEPFCFAGPHPVLACIYCRDCDGREREVHRVYDVRDLDVFTVDGPMAAGLARSVAQIAGLLR